MALTEDRWIPDRLAQLDELLRRSSYRGWDPFDLSNSPLFARIPARSWLPQLVLTKAGARLAGDRVRRFLRVPYIEDPKTYACAYVGYRFGGLPGFRERAEDMVDRIAALATPQSGGRRAWGYGYVWATRSSGVNPLGASTLVPGSFAALTLLHHAVDSGDRRHMGLTEEALDHYADQHACSNSAGPFLGYFERVTANTHNANLLGCVALTLGAVVLNRPDWFEQSAEAAETTVRSVRETGYLPYDDQPSGDWTDCFHHLYVLACARTLARINPRVDGAVFDQAVDRMWQYARRRFLREDGLVNYFPDTLHPVDPHNYAATAIFAVMAGPGAGLPSDYSADLLRRVDAIMWDDDRNAYAYRRRARRADRRSFLRWTQAWMFAALAVAGAPDEFRRQVDVPLGTPDH